MISLDMHTVVFVAAISYMICALFVVQLWGQHRDRFDGLGYLAISAALQTVSLVFFASRGVIPDWISTTLANMLLMAGTLMGYIGLERFLKKPGPQLHNYILLAGGSFAVWFFFVVQPDMAKRAIVISVFTLMICGQCLWLLWRRVEPVLRPLAFGTGMIFFSYCLLNIVRIAGYLVDVPQPSDFYQSNGFQALVLVFYPALLVLLTYSLMQMVNRRLVMEITAQQEKFFSAFQLAPYAITLVRLSDGMIVDTNRAFEVVSGYDRAEAVGKSAIDLHMWAHEEDRASVMADLESGGKVKPREANFRTKSGVMVTGMFSAELLIADGERYALSCILDITARKQAEIAANKADEHRRNLFNHSHVVMLLIDPDGGAIVAANQAAADFYGWTREQLQNMRIDQINLLPPAEVAVAVQRANNQQCNNFEFRHRLANGQGRNVEVFSGPMQIGDRTLLFSIVHEITDRVLAARQLAESEAKRQAEMRAALEAQQQARLAAMNLMEDAIAASASAEEALTAMRRSESRFELAMQASQDGLWEWNVQTDESYHSPRWYEIIGYAKDDPALLPSSFKTWESRIHPDDQQRVMGVINAHLHKRNPFSVEYRHRHHSGEYRWQHSRGLTVFDASGTPTKMVGSISDITERKNAEFALERISRLYAILSRSNEAIVHCDSEAILFPHICHTAVHVGGMKMAWIGMVDEVRRALLPIASSGDTTNYLADIRISMDADNLRGMGPAGMAVRENRPVWCQDFLHDPSTAPWHESGAQADLIASAALPLCRNGRAVGTLTLYAGEVNFFDEGVQTLLIEMAAGISFAMDSYAAVTERKRAETNMSEQLEELRRWQQLMLGREGRILSMKKEVNALLAERGLPARYSSMSDTETK
jgi:PAS domain S-box-containing protein